MSELEAELGPAMAALTEKRRAFVKAVIATSRNGKTNYSAAAKAAGYGDPKNANVAGYQLSKDPKVQAALHEEAKRELNTAAVFAATTWLPKIAEDENIPTRDRLRAIEMILVRGGFPAQTEHKVTVEHRNPAQMLELAVRLAKEIGVDEKKLLGVNRPGVVDGEFTELPVVDVSHETSRRADEAHNERGVEDASEGASVG